jgi:hypothetical protein
VKSIFVVAVFALLCLPALAEDWTTSDGVCYQDVKVIKVEDDAITIIYKDGGALVPLAKLPPAIQQKFDYDPDKAKAAAAARTKADAQSAKQLQAEIELADKMRQDQLAKEAKSQTNSTTK